jgi:hypothetical protein
VRWRSNSPLPYRADTIANGTTSMVIVGTMASGTVAKNENGTNIVNITVTMATGRTATTIVTKTTVVKIYGSGRSRKGVPRNDSERQDRKGESS